MAVFKRFKGKKITSKHPRYANAKWWCYKRVRGQKPIYKSLPDAVTKDDAEKAERAEIQKAFNRRYGIPDTTTTFSEFADKTYLKYVRQNNVNQTAKKQYVELLKNFFKQKPLSDITAQDCRDCQYRLKTNKSDRGKLSPSSVNRIMSTLSKLFTLACEEGILERNPMQYVRSLKEPPPRKMLLTPEQKIKLYAECEKDEFLRDIVNLALNLPLRKGQLLALTADAIDFERRLLKATTSKGRDERLVPMNKKVFVILKRLSAKYPSGALLRIDNKPVKDFRKRWRTALVNAGINKKEGKRGEGFSFHDLRKEFTTALLRKGIPLTDVQDLLAHSSPDITKIYAVSTMDNLHEAVDSLDGE